VATLALTIEDEEFAGLSALAELEKSPDAAAMALTLLRRTLADRLKAADLPGAPSAEAVAARTAGSGTGRNERQGMTRKFVAYILAIATVVVLIGGYGANWRWTGFQANGQLWDWLSTPATLRNRAA
jgi:hypothetical protein